MPLMLEHFFYPDRLLILQCYHVWGIYLLPSHPWQKSSCSKTLVLFSPFRFLSIPCPVSASPSHPDIPIKHCIFVAQGKGLKARSLMMVLCAGGVVKQKTCLPLLPRPGGLEMLPAPKFSSESLIEPQREQILLTDSSLLLVLMSERLRLLCP